MRCYSSVATSLPRRLVVNMSKKPAGPSSNWLALQKKLSTSQSAKSSNVDTTGTITKKSAKRIAASLHTDEVDFERSSKRTKLNHDDLPSTNASILVKSKAQSPQPTNGDIKNGESLSSLRKMVRGKLVYTPSQQLPGKYLAIDCEMVGVGVDGSESSLARVSVVNFHGAVQMDVFVRQRERVVDYRTQWSGIRASDMVNASPFDEVQKKVAALLENRILVGHAVFNDLKALLLSHPRPLTRDTQHLSGKHKLTKSKYPALRTLAQQELDIAIQTGEHSSLTDARATMALYRLHRKEWDKGFQPVLAANSKTKTEDASKIVSLEPAKKKRGTSTAVYPGGGRKGVSSGLSVIMKHGPPASKQSRNSDGNKDTNKDQWWKHLS